jgi:hypothetical protein
MFKLVQLLAQMSAQVDLALHLDPTKPPPVPLRNLDVSEMKTTKLQ